MKTGLRNLCSKIQQFIQTSMQQYAEIYADVYAAIYPDIHAAKCRKIDGNRGNRG